MAPKRGIYEPFKNIRFPAPGWGPRTFDVLSRPEDCSASEIDFDQIARGVVHETQGFGLPNYPGSAPHFTLGPLAAGAPWRCFQHLGIGRAACALKSAGSTPPPTNYGARVQVELAAITTRAKHMPDVEKPDQALIESFFEMCQERAEIPEKYPYDPADMATGLWASTTNPWRQSKKWETVAGWHPHAAVDKNDHWDVGGLLVPALLRIEDVPDLVVRWQISAIWREAGDDHPHVRELTPLCKSVNELLDVADSAENRAEIKKFAERHPRGVRIVRQKIAA